MELYAPREDPEERRDLAAEMPDRTRELKAELEARRAAAEAQPPIPDMAYDPSNQP